MEDIGNSVDKRHRIGYYQWVPLMLICQAILFYVPRALWRAFNVYSGIAVHTITDAAIESQRDKEYDKSDKLMGFMVRHTGRYLKDLRRSISDSAAAGNERCRRALLQMRGSYLTVLYMVVKLVYLGNIVGQSFLLNVFLGTNYHLYGVEVIRKMTSGQDWTTSDRFPRVTLCDVEIRRVGNVHRHTVQCTLPMNLLNEIFFIFLWFWFVFVGLVTIGSLIIWLINSISVKRQTKLVRGHLYAVGKLRSTTMADNKKKLEEFVTGYLRRDGCFILRMVSKNASDVIAAELTSGLWDHFNKHQYRPRRLMSRMDTVDAAGLLASPAVEKYD